MARRLRKTVNLCVTVIQIVESLRRSWFLQRDVAGDFMPAFAPYPGEYDDFEYQLDVNPWRDDHTDQELFDSFIDPFGVFKMFSDSPAGTRAVWSFNAHMLFSIGVYASNPYSAFNNYMALRYMNAVTVAPILATTYVGTNLIHSAQSSIIEDIVSQPGREHEESSWWQVFSSALTGGFNPNIQL